MFLIIAIICATNLGLDKIMTDNKQERKAEASKCLQDNFTSNFCRNPLETDAIINEIHPKFNHDATQTISGSEFNNEIKKAKIYLKNNYDSLEKKLKLYETFLRKVFDLLSILSVYKTTKEEIYLNMDQRKLYIYERIMALKNIREIKKAQEEIITLGVEIFDIFGLTEAYDLSKWSSKTFEFESNDYLEEVTNDLQLLILQSNQKTKYTRKFA